MLETPFQNQEPEQAEGISASTRECQRANTSSKDSRPFCTQPQLWIQLDRRDQEASQWTVSPRFDGRVEVEFQFLRGPFASLEARRQIWERLTAIPGLVLEQRLNGRPTFPIDVLTEDDRLGRFLDVLSYIIDETLHASGPAEPAPNDDPEISGEHA